MSKSFGSRVWAVVVLRSKGLWVWALLALVGFLAGGAIRQNRALIEEQDAVIRAHVKVVLMLCARACDTEVIEVCESMKPPARYAPEKEVY